MWQQNKRKSKIVFLWMMVILLIAFLGGCSWLMYKSQQEAPISEQAALDAEAEPAISSMEVSIVLKKSFVCGVESEEKLSQMVASTDQVIQDYQDWQLLSQEGNHFEFGKQVNDLAPICKEKGYFGLSKDGILTLYEGPPEEQKVIQTFFQINTKKLESALPMSELEFLQKGIRITDIAEYNSILSSYEEFANLTGNVKKKVEADEG
ncbi:BofC C-terminal domain-containing protein [Ammoniphilus resinae]|uniref:Forespore regulator of the sigma-K checkpoint n=1 Tax=Ammoniphilus resinae TaxID=861532 RepID=A0ABS4GJK3_9BACL|nr:BofC C-terminal domain-containing protein [Ammoniphilus resinae]MBP1930429.1 forespore regulator of the sigma-K checkpoint [Ammoniphilus resinae]